jgi:hypothetical protein
MPVHHFAHLRVAYGLGVFGTLWRMAALYALTTAGAGVLFLAAILLSIWDAGRIV